MSVKILTDTTLEKGKLWLSGSPDETGKLKPQCGHSGLTIQDYITRRLLSGCGGYRQPRYKPADDWPPFWKNWSVSRREWRGWDCWTPSG
jgi:hypothetical protein